jgi:beta-galactosidase
MKLPKPLLLILFVLCIPFNQHSAQTRQQVSLNGTWDFKWDNDLRLSFPPSGEGWTTIEVGPRSRSSTGFGSRGENHWAWYRRNLTVPNSMRGERIKIRFERVQFKTHIYFNGVKVGEHLDGEIPFEIDVTEHVRFNGQNELLVGVVDRISLQRPDLLPYVDRDFSGPSGNADPPRGSLLGAASWIHHTYGGICDDVTLVSCPEVHIDDFHITTSVRRSEIMVEVKVTNEGRSSRNHEVHAFIEDNGARIMEFPVTQIRTTPGQNSGVLFLEKWENPHLWSHYDPYLYTLVVQVRGGNRVIDERRFRFGFREFWIEGTQFYLNGRVFKMRRHPLTGLQDGASREEIRTWMEELKSININNVRIHTQGFPERIVEVANEAGMTITTESNFWSRAPQYDIENPKMWENARIQWAGLVKMYRNHPSVVMHSIENEMLSTGAYLMHQDPAKWASYQEEWKKIGQFVRNLDPTKPLQYSWGHDLQGWAETANIHYVRDIRYFFQYPRDLYWLEGENLTQIERNRDYRWTRDRPLIKGEYEYWFHSNPPHGLTPYIGEKAYIGDNWYQAWQWCVKKKKEAYRYSGITANPWTFGPDRYKFFPLQEVFLKDWRQNYYGGERLRKEVIVVNEDFEPADLRLDVTLNGGGRALASKTFSLQMSEGSRWVNDIEFALPVVSERVNATLDLKLMKDGLEIYANQYTVNIFPVGERFRYDVNSAGLFDPDGKTLREMTHAGFIFRRINELTKSSLSGLQVLILGKDAVTRDFHEEGELLREFVRNGGRMIVLEQSYVEKFSWMPFEVLVDKTIPGGNQFTGRTDLPILDDVSLRGLNSTVAFQAMPDHPIMAGIEEEDLRYWRGNHQVSKNSFHRPRFWNFNTVAYVGSTNGIEHSPLITLPWGRGIFIMSQFIISEEMSKDPVAFNLFNNITRYAHEFVPRQPVRAAVLANDGCATRRIIRTFGAVVDDIPDISKADLNSYQLLFANAGMNLESHRAVIERFLDNGGRIVLRELTPENISNVRWLLPGDFTIEPIPEPELTRLPTGTTCPSRVHKAGYDPLLAGITNFDLYWRSPSGYTAIFGNEIAPVASYVITGSNMVSLTAPVTVYARIPTGNGEIIIDQVNWETGLQRVRNNTSRIISNFINNLGVEMRPYNHN